MKTHSPALRLAKSRRALTLLELVMVVSILAVLTAMVVPGMNAQNEETRAAEAYRASANRWRNINLVALGSFAIISIFGIAEANYNFVPDKEVRRTRPIPPPVAIQPLFHVSGSGGELGGQGMF